MKRTVFALASLIFLCSEPVFAVDGVYLGGRVGQVGLSGRTKAAHNNGIGYGFDVGFRTNALIDVMLLVSRSNHSAGLDLSSILISADLELGRASDFAFVLGIGPGFYFFKTSTTETNFGLHGSLAGDLWVDDTLRVGLVFRWNGVFSGTLGDSYWTVMARLGYMFET